MNTYRLTLKPVARLASPIQSDTLFGHLCWAITHADGEAELEKFLALFETEPPLVLSSAFPEGMLPTPCLPPLTRAQMDALAGARFAGKIIAASATVKRLTVSYLPLARVVSIAATMTNDGLVGTILDTLGLTTNVDEKTAATKQKAYSERAEPKADVIMRTQIDRVTGQARDGALFDDAQDFYPPDKCLTLWLKLNDEMEARKKWLWQRFHDIARGGFGARLSTGAGAFQIVEIKAMNDLKTEEQLPRVDNPNAFVSLSAYAPRAGEPTDGGWQYLVKRGKLGAERSTNALAGRATPHVWKYPLVLFQPGSVFRDAAPREWYGRLVPEMHALYPDVRQYAYAFPLGVRLVEGGPT